MHGQCSSSSAGAGDHCLHRNILVTLSKSLTPCQGERRRRPVRRSRSANPTETGLYYLHHSDVCLQKGLIVCLHKGLISQGTTAMLATPSPAPTVFVTGGSGFLGRHCLSEMVRQGFRVHAVSHRRTYPVNGVHWHNIDLNASGSARALMAALRPTHFLHLAWITTPEFYRFTPENFDWLDASLALVRAFGEHGGQRFVGVGSANEYRADDRPCGEDETPIRPITIYGRCKAALWMGAEAYAQHYGFSAAWGRVFVPYGSGDPQQRLILSLMTAMSAGEPIDVTDRNPDEGFHICARCCRPARAFARQV